MPLNSDSWRQSINSLCSKMTIEASHRNRLAASLYHISNQHHYSIIELVMKKHLGSAFALARPQMEAYIRGEWAANCASEEEILVFLEGKGKTRLDFYTNALEANKDYDHSALLALKDSVWSLFCDFTHGGGSQASWHISKTSIGYVFGSPQIKQLRNVSDSVALSNSLSFARLCSDERISKRICASHKRIFNIKNA
ncbi:DUF6988 family protein [Vibrio barjaei]|uniref:DUF6988 family protein n=1 Tax=Vibrio barjaei TaxID=1676683 RepID=UPI002284E2B6|nr:hypothetical protein [Vibrio barjaei]MCY9871170.1 hypothetical protein [Vibrio barjaei]